MRRFYAPPENFQADTIILDLEQTRHLRDVLRLHEGDTVQIFDGDGNEFLTAIENISKKETTLKIFEKIPATSPESNLELTLAVALLKGEKFDLAVQKCVELGVTKFVPLITKRCDVKPRDAEKKIERWRKIILESSKQCGRAKLMQIDEPKEFRIFTENCSDETKILFSERGGTKFSDLIPEKKITAVTGAEGGWEDSELDFAKSEGFQIVTFGGRILRAETAVIAVSAILQNRFGDLN